MESTQLQSQFLIAEYNALQSRAQSFEQIKSSRLNFFLIVVAAVWAGLASLARIVSLEPYLSSIVIAADVFLLLLGLLTLFDLTGYSAAIIAFYRRAGRVRRWFVDLDADMANYVAFHPADDRPKFTTSMVFISWRGADAVVLMINSVMLAGLAGFTAWKAFSASSYVCIAILLITFILGWMVQILFVRTIMVQHQNAEINKKEINFPYERFEREDTLGEVSNEKVNAL
jgi:hypothetical protein